LNESSAPLSSNKKYNARQLNGDTKESIKKERTEAKREVATDQKRWAYKSWNRLRTFISLSRKSRRKIKKVRCDKWQEKLENQQEKPERVQGNQEEVQSVDKG
jgi:hypothetical protein